MINPSIGTELKVAVSAEPVGGIHLSEYDFECDFFVYRNQKITVRKDDMRKLDDDNYVALLDSSKLSAGNLLMRMTAHVPDTDFPDGLRTEVVEVDTGIKLVK